MECGPGEVRFDFGIFIHLNFLFEGTTTHFPFARVEGEAVLKRYNQVQSNNVTLEITSESDQGTHHGWHTDGMTNTVWSGTDVSIALG